MTYSASIEWLCEHAGILRLHPHADGRVGDEYVWSCSIADSVGNVAVIKGVCKPLPLGGPKAIVRALKEAGYAGRCYERTHGRTVSKANGDAPAEMVGALGG